MWYFSIYTHLCGAEEYGGYETEGEANEGIYQVRAKARKLNDGLIRHYSDPYFVKEGK